MRKERRHLKNGVMVGVADAESLQAADVLGAQVVLTKNRLLDVRRCANCCGRIRFLYRD